MRLYVFFIILCLVTVQLILKRYNPLGIFLMILFDLTAFFAILSYNRKLIDVTEVTIFGLFFLVLAYCLFAAPFLRREYVFGAEKVISTNRNYYLFALFYIIVTIVSIKCYLPTILNMLGGGFDWGTNRMAFNNGELSFPYSNTIEYLCINLSSYLQLVALIVGFKMISEESKKVLGFILLGCGILTDLMASMYNSSRGSILILGMLILGMYVFFNSSFEKNIKRFAIIAGAMISVVVVPYVIEVTVSRFSRSAALNSIIFYFGHAPTTFAANIVTIDKLSWGQYGLGRLFGVTSFSQSAVGGSWGDAFYTFVGWLYIDWGPIGVILIGIAMYFLLNHLTKKETYLISDVFLFFFVYKTLLSGVFVIGRNYCYTIVSSLIIYVILRIFMDKYEYRIGRIRF